MAQQLRAIDRIALHPVADHLGRDLMFVIDAAPDQLLPDGFVVMSIRRAISDPQGFATRKLDPARALDLQEEHINRIIDPGEWT